MTLGRLALAAVLGFLLWRACAGPQTATDSGSKTSIWMEPAAASVPEVNELPKHLVTCANYPGSMEFNVSILHQTLCWDARKQVFVRIEIKEQ